MRITNVHKAIAIAIRAKGQWLHAWNFNSYEDIFIGHRGCARISDAAKDYDELIDVRRDATNPRMYEYRFKHEDVHNSFGKLPKELVKYLEEQMNHVRMPYTKKREVVEIRNGVAHISTVLEKYNSVPDSAIPQDSHITPVEEKTLFG